MALRTVGHGTLARDRLAALLAGADIELVVDVRRSPGSRRHPHVNRDALERWLPEHGISYRWEEALGGRRSGAPDSPNVAVRDPGLRAYTDHMYTEEWRAALAGLLDEARVLPLAVLCAESVWWRCHRRFIADAAVLLHDVEVVHLMHDGQLAPHRATDGVRVVGDRLIYDAGEVQPPLFGP